MKTVLPYLFALVSLTAAEPSSTALMKSAAEGFLASLDDAKRAKAAFPIHADDRENFRYTPRERSGLPLKEMDESQRKAAMKLLESALSDKGRLKAMQVITLEGVLAEIEKRPEYRDAGRYYVSIFGKPGDAAGWGWKFEGHHLSLNYAIRGAEVSVTPSFMGANPAEVREGVHKGLRPFGAEEDLARALALVLMEGGKSGVRFSDKAPTEILTGENRNATALEPVGITAEEMSAAQKKALFELVSEYTGRHRKDLAEADMKKITAAGIGRIRFGWAGGLKRGEAFYYRVQGPTFLMECANTQNDANHIHLTWRDFEGDYGRDLMKQHYQHHKTDGVAH
jgi:Protein of unknown function (DUF3500)